MGAIQSTTQSYVLETKLGSLKGIEQQDTSGKPVCRRFLRVPYALPPVEQLRWRRPQPLPKAFTFNDSSGSPGDYTKFGPICPQPPYGHETAVVKNESAAPEIDNIQSEDCLYLNIWTPCGDPPPQGWPVQFYIHGGWLQVGDACQQNENDPFDLFAHDTPRVIVAPTYRLNMFGFLAGSELASLGEDPAPANYGLWDQRAALEWTAKHIALFGGNPDNITVGGLSAGANSTFFQLYYDTQLPAEQRLIKRIYLWSNSVLIQPNRSTSAPLTEQFNELCSVHSIPTSISASDKLARLRAIPAQDLVSSISRLKFHTFRSSTDNDFIPETFLSTYQSGFFTTLLAKHNVGVMLGEVKEESKLYKLVNPPSNYDDLVAQVSNYYPKQVVDALLQLYPVPHKSEQDAEKWADAFSHIVGDGQVHVPLRGFTHLLLNPPKHPGVVPAKPSNVHRYRICYRAKGLEDWLQPSVGVCHGSDTPIWWGSGWRAGFGEDDKKKTQIFLKPFGQFLNGETVEWGRKEESGADKIRLINEDGVTHEDVQDDLWDRAMEVWQGVWNGQKDTVVQATNNLTKN